MLSCSRMSENHREPGVPEEEDPVVECRDGLARITSKELEITHFVKSGTLQNACSTRPRVVAITVHQVSPIDQCWVHRRGDTPMKNATKNLASSTNMRKSFATFGNRLYPLGS